MRSVIHLLLISCVLTAAPREESRRDFAKTATLASGRSVRVENSNGRVRIRTHAGNQVQINAVIRCSAPTADEARRGLDQVRIIVDEGASGVTVRTEYPRNWQRNVSYAADYELLTPEAAPLEVRNRFGEVDVAGIHASVTINSGNGPVTLIGARGQQRIENSFGTVEVRNVAGDVTVNNGNGRVTVADVTGAVDITNRFDTIRVINAGRGLTIHSNNGHIEAENVTGIATVTNSFGPVTVSEMKGDVRVQNQNGDVIANAVSGAADLHTTFAAISFSRIGKGLVAQAQNSGIRGDTVGESAVIETTFGSVDVRGVKGGARVTTNNSSVKLSGIGGEVYAKATFNGVNIAEAGGPVTVENQNGSITVDAKSGPCQPLALRTSFGPIRVTVPRAAGYNLTAHTSFGRIHTDGVQVSVSGDISQDNLTGRIGAGGCELRLNDQNGGIDIIGR
jgi:DUF4097 and DUF4098 domain-containing protein YvlB